jgi:hypothetical protein
MAKHMSLKRVPRRPLGPPDKSDPPWDGAKPAPPL